MTQFTALALDPGGTSGWSVYQSILMTNPNLEYEWYDEHWNCGHLEGADHSEDLLALLEIQATEEYHVICERFVIRPGKVGAKLDIAPKYIALVEEFKRQRPETDLIMQMPSQAKAFVKDQSIRKLGLWCPGWKHAMDAMRHLLFWLANGPYHRKDLLEKGWKFKEK